jgi:cell division protein FtsL
VWEKKMVSEDLEKILALIIVTFSFLSIPLLLFLFVIAIYFDVTYVIQFYHTRNFTDALIAVFLAIVNVGLFLFLRFLIRWVRK